MAESLVRNILKNTLFSYSAKMFAVAAGFLYVLLLANYLGPALFGQLSFLVDFFASGVMLLGFTAATETLPVFVPKLKSKTFARRIITYSLVGAAVVSLVLFATPKTFVSLVKEGSEGAIRAVALITFLNISSTLLASFLGSARNFGKILKVALWENSSNLLLSGIVIFVFHGGLSGLLYAKAASLAVSTVVAWWFFHRSELPENPSASLAVAKKFFANSAALGLLRRGSSQVLLYLMTLFTNPAALGLYYIIQKISTYMIDMPVNSLNDVLLPVSSEHESMREKLHRITSLSIKLYLVASLVFSVFLLLLGPLVLYVFFPAYVGAAALLPLFCLYFLMTFDIPLGTFFRAINRNEVLTKSNVLVLLFTVFPGYWIISGFGIQGVVLTMVLGRAAQLAYQYHDVKKNNYAISFIPTRQDFEFFVSTFEAELLSLRNR